MNAFNIGTHLRRLMLFALALFILISLWCFFWPRPHSPLADDYIVFLPADDGDERRIVQEIICPKGANYCFKVEDYIQPEEEGEIRYQRRLMVESEEDVVLSMVDLIPNPDEPFCAKNALHWPIQKDKLSLDYIKGMIGQMLATGCFQIADPDVETSKKGRTLMVGLGGAAIPNILAELNPNHEIISVELEPAVEYIARKWFGLEETAKQRVLIRDGVDYIRTEWTEADGRFDCLIIDACHANIPAPGERYPLMCPVESFVNHERIVERMYQMLRARGTLLINTFMVETWENIEKVAETRQFLLELFRHHFGYCYYAALPFNKILVCPLAFSERRLMTNELYNERIQKLPKWLREELQMEMNIEQDVWRPKGEM